MTAKISFLREGSKAADRSIDYSYRPVVSPIFTLNLRHKFTRSIALRKRTFSKSQIRLRTTFTLSFWHLYNDGPPAFIALPTPVCGYHAFNTNLIPINIIFTRFSQSLYTTFVVFTTN